jgi:L-cysteine S-thiosulfotransferase
VRLRVAGIVGSIASAALALAGGDAARAQSPARVADYAVVGDAIPSPLAGATGDATRGRTIVTSRQLGLCLLCHGGPFPEERLQGSIAPDLTGVASRLSEGQIRLRIVDARRVNPATTMPPYHRVDGLERVGASWRGRPILDAQQVEDVVALMRTLTD